MVAYMRARRPLWSAAGLLVGLILVGWDLWIAASTFVPQYPVRNDLRLAYGAALVGIRDGYSRLYDLSAQTSAIESLGPGFNPQPFISPPPLAWLVTPLLALPFTAALAVWTLVLVAALVWTWHLLAPPGRLAKAAHLALWLGLFVWERIRDIVPAARETDYPSFNNLPLKGLDRRIGFCRERPPWRWREAGAPSSGGTRNATEGVPYRVRPIFAS